MNAIERYGRDSAARVEDSLAGSDRYRSVTGSVDGLAVQAKGSSNLVNAGHKPGEILVRFAPEATAEVRHSILGDIGGKVSEILRGSTLANGAEGMLARVTVGHGLTVAQAIEIISKRPGVSSAEPNFIYRIDATADDPAYAGGQLWGMYGDQTSPANQYGSQAGEAWGAGYTGSARVVVGVVDTGIDYTHPDLYLNIWLNQGEIPLILRGLLADTDDDSLISFRDLNAPDNANLVSDLNSNGFIDAGDLLRDSAWENNLDEDENGYVDDLIGWDFVNEDNDPYDDNSHGTHVSGTIAAIGGNGLGVAGVSWATQIVPLKFLAADGSGTTADAIRALDYFTQASSASAIQDFAATNNSWGGGGFSQSLLDAIVRGAKGDILFVAAAGNGGSDGIGDDNDSAANYPSNYDTTAQAGYDAVIAVASITSTGVLSSFSNYGKTSVDLGAPGSLIRSTIPGGGYGTYSGTSMATPHVAGAIALYSAVAGATGSSEIKANLLGAVTGTSSLASTSVSGGRLDVAGLMFTGTREHDARLGGSTNDLFRLQQGGNDSVSGGAGADIFLFGAALTEADQVQGGEGADILVLQGNYNLTLGAGSLVGVETLSPLPGTDMRFGAPGGVLYDYAIKTVDANVTAGAKLTINGARLEAGEDLTVDGSAESDGTFLIYAGKGIDTLTGGAGADIFFFGIERFALGDRIDGGAGADIVILRGDYSVVFNPDTFLNVETVTLMSASDTRFASGGLAYHYDVTTQDANIAAGATFTFNGGALRSDETVLFDGSAESDGHFRLFGGGGEDRLTGGTGNDLIRSGGSRDQIDAGGGNDTLRGGLGGDLLDGGPGSDVFDYTSTAESTGVDYDTLVGFDYRVDKINLPGIVSGWTGDVTSGSLSTASFDADLSAALDEWLQPNSAVLFKPDQGDLAGRTFAVVDGNGDGNYQAGSDIVLQFSSPNVPLPQTSDFFV